MAQQRRSPEGLKGSAARERPKCEGGIYALCPDNTPGVRGVKGVESSEISSNTHTFGAGPLAAVRTAVVAYHGRTGAF